MECKRSLSEFGCIGDLKDDELLLITDSQDVDMLKETFGNPEMIQEFEGFFVRERQGAFEEVFCFRGIIPNNWKRVYRFTQEYI